jgi:hypothetical protein
MGGYASRFKCIPHYAVVIMSSIINRLHQFSNLQKHRAPTLGTAIYGTTAR